VRASATSRILPRIALTLGLGALASAAACSSPPADDSDTSVGAMNVNNARITVCGRSGEAEGCDPCSAKIGAHELNQEERDSCTLKSLRSVLRDRVSYLVADAGRRGIFFRSVSGDSPTRLAEMKITPVVGPGAKAREDVFTKLAGSFTVGQNDEPSARAGVDVHAVRMSVGFQFVFEDASGEGAVRNEPYTMANTYNIIPFFYMRANVGVNLSIGAIISAFTGQSEIATSLLSVLGGSAGLSLQAEQEVRWSTPVCSDTVNDHSPRGADRLTVFDYDFYTNVLKPACERYKADGHQVSCDFGQLLGETEPFFDSVTRAIGSRRMLPVVACQQIEGSSFGANVYDITFTAPERWGFEPGHEGYLFQRDSLSSTSWVKRDWVRVYGVERKGECGGKPLAAGDVCVHAELPKRFFADDCAAIATQQSPRFGVSQSEGTNGRIFADLR
jgi:hypothetical protein